MFTPATPAAAGAQPAAADQQDGPSVCITKKADGSYAVYPEQDDDTSAEAAPGEEQDEMANAQTAPDFNGAMAIAKQMLDGGVAPTDPAAKDDGTSGADALFQQGFDKARGVPLNRA